MTSMGSENVDASCSRTFSFFEFRSKKFRVNKAELSSTRFLVELKISNLAENIWKFEN